MQMRQDGQKPRWGDQLERAAQVWLCRYHIPHRDERGDGTTPTSDNPSSNKHKPMGSQGLGGGKETAQLLGCQLEERWGRKG